MTDLSTAAYLVDELAERGFICTAAEAIEYLGNNRYDINHIM